MSMPITRILAPHIKTMSAASGSPNTCTKLEHQDSALVVSVQRRLLITIGTDALCYCYHRSYTLSPNTFMEILWIFSPDSSWYWGMRWMGRQRAEVSNETSCKKIVHSLQLQGWHCHLLQTLHLRSRFVPLSLQMLGPIPLPACSPLNDHLLRYLTLSHHRKLGRQVSGFIFMGFKAVR